MAVPEFKILFTGDICFSDEAADALHLQGYTSILSDVKVLADQYDYVVGNLEAPVTEPDQGLKGKILLSTTFETVDGLAWAGFDLLNCANNHLLDYGVQGMRCTFKALDERGIRYLGAGENLISASTEVSIQTPLGPVVFLAYADAQTYCAVATENAPGCNPMQVERMVSDIHRLKETHRYVIVNLHWGIEEYHYPSARQRETAHQLIDSGADALIGHHPHVMQGIEIYQGKPIAYSLGNLVFADAQRYDGVMIRRSQANRLGMAVGLTLTESGISPLYQQIFSLDDSFKLHCLEGKTKDEALKQIETWSDVFRDVSYPRFWRRFRIQQELLKPMAALFTGRFPWSTQSAVRRVQLKFVVSLFIKGPFHLLQILLGREPDKWNTSEKELYLKQEN